MINLNKFILMSLAMIDRLGSFLVVLNRRLDQIMN